MFGINQASPPPTQVLSAARRFVGRAHSLSYRLEESITSPVGAGGDQLLQSRAVSGTTAFAHGSDFVVTAAGRGSEYRSLAATPGVWVRVSATPSALVAAGWSHAGSYAAFESHALAGSGQGSSPSDVARAVVLDEVSAGDAVPALIRAAGEAKRHGSSVRTLDVVFDPAAALGAGATAVGTITGQIAVDAHDRPTALTVTMRVGPDAVVLHYLLAWGAPVTISPPASSDVISSV